MAYAAQTTGTAHGVAARLAAIAADISERLARRRAFRNTYNELMTLSGRELADLGIHRSEIKRIAYEAAYKN